MNNSKEHSMYVFPTVSFFSRPTRGKKEKHLLIYMRISLHGNSRDISLNQKINLGQWDVHKQQVKGNSENSRMINQLLVDMKNKVFKLQMKYSQSEELLSLEEIVQTIKGKTTKGKTLLELIDLHNTYKQGLVGIDITHTTLMRYKTVRLHVEQFLKEIHKRDDILLAKLKNAHAIEFEAFLKTNLNIGHNTAVKYVRNLKTIIRYGIDIELLNKDPFIKHKTKIKEVKRECLTKRELETLVDKKVENERIGLIRDAFVFCCYTGLAYSDIQSLTMNEITIGIDGDQWIKTSRKKTGNEVNVPLLPSALRIIEKYNDHPIRLNDKKVLPVISNQKMNVYLKELADICGIDKNLTTHLARHTFATTITLSNGVTMESVSKMLGHSSIKTTQIYAKITDTKVSREMQKIKEMDGTTEQKQFKIG